MGRPNRRLTTGKAEGRPEAEDAGVNRGRLCTLAAALLHDVGQAVAVEGLEELVHPQALVTARVEARLGLKLAAAALLCIELRARLGEQLLPLRREIKWEMTVRSR